MHKSVLWKHRQTPPREDCRKCAKKSVKIYKIAIYILLVVIISAIVSHKMAGPVYRFEQTCREIAKGDFSQRVHLRKGDQLTELQDAFNAMMDTVEKQVNHTKDS